MDGFSVCVVALSRRVERMNIRYIARVAADREILLHQFLESEWKSWSEGAYNGFVEWIDKAVPAGLTGERVRNTIVIRLRDVSRRLSRSYLEGCVVDRARDHAADASQIILLNDILALLETRYRDQEVTT